jgi:hypothetical protein
VSARREVALLAAMTALAIGGAAATGTSCARPASGEDLRPPPGFAAPAVRPLQKAPLRAHRLEFGAGFSPLEVGPDGTTWRWMGSHGEIRLTNDAGRRHELRVRARLFEGLARPPSIRIAVNGHVLDSFQATGPTLDRRYTVEAEIVAAASQPGLTIDTSETGNAPDDPRDLGLAVERLDWTAMR